MAHELAALIAQYGLLLVFLSAAVEQAGIPVPAFPLLLVAGALAAAGQLPVAALVLSGVAGCLLPDLAWYWAGRRFGARVMATLCRISLSPDSCIHRSQLHFERWRGRSLLVAKFVPGLSVIAPPLVGALGLRMRPFVLLDGAGSLLWVGVAVGLGYAFAGQVNRVLMAVGRASTLALAAVLGLLALYVGLRWWHRHRVRVALRMPRISPAELHAAVMTDRAPLVLDVRASVARHLNPRLIEGATLVDPAHLRDVLRGVPFDREIVTYCDCPHEATSARVAGLLRKQGYRHVRPLRGGIGGWIDAGYVVCGAAPATSPVHDPIPPPRGVTG